MHDRLHREDEFHNRVNDLRHTFDPEVENKPFLVQLMSYRSDFLLSKWPFPL